MQYFVQKREVIENTFWREPIRSEREQVLHQNRIEPLLTMGGN